MTLGWTAYVAPKLSEGAQKRKIAIFWKLTVSCFEAPFALCFDRYMWQTAVKRDDKESENWDEGESEVEGEEEDECVTEGQGQQNWEDRGTDTKSDS